MGNSFNHIDENGNAVMVDVSEKENTDRVAVACGLAGARPDNRDDARALCALHHVLTASNTTLKIVPMRRDT